MAARDRAPVGNGASVWVAAARRRRRVLRPTYCPRTSLRDRASPGPECGNRDAALGLGSELGSWRRPSLVLLTDGRYFTYHFRPRSWRPRERVTELVRCVVRWATMACATRRIEPQIAVDQRR